MDTEDNFSLLYLVQSNASADRAAANNTDSTTIGAIIQPRSCGRLFNGAGCEFVAQGSPCVAGVNGGKVWLLLLLLLLSQLLFGDGVVQGQLAFRGPSLLVPCLSFKTADMKP